MPNMSYCRFENTAHDLRDCYNWLGENNWTDLSQTEKQAFLKMVNTCLKLAQDYAPELLNLEIEVEEI